LAIENARTRDMLKDPPLLTVARNLRRPSRALLASLEGAQTGHIVDALEGRGALDHRIKPVDPERAAFVAPALTCETGANDNLAVLAALVLAQPGDALMVAADGFAATAVVGDNVAAMARNKDIAAIVIDGMARDSAGIVETALPVFARGITPNSCVRSGPGKVGLAVVCGGVAVAPGDVLVGDRDGVVVIPAAELETVVARLTEIRALEEATQAKIRAGMTHLDSIAQLLSSDRVRYID
jgi:4-hydroxy-4-methyl-2-oxoglutarate aldolase